MQVNVFDLPFEGLGFRKTFVMLQVYSSIKCLLLFLVSVIFISIGQGYVASEIEQIFTDLFLRGMSHIPPWQILLLPQQTTSSKARMLIGYGPSLALTSLISTDAGHPLMIV